MKKNHLKLLSLLLISAVTALPLQGGETVLETAKTPVEVVQEDADCVLCHYLDTIPVLYKNAENPLLQEFRLQGRYQYQTAYGDYEGDTFEGDDFNHDESRRWYIGAKFKFLKQFTFSGNVVLNSELNPTYSKIDGANLSWKPNENLKILLGKHRARFTQELSTSSRKINTFERSLLVNQTGHKKSLAISAHQKFDRLTLSAGIFSGKVDDEFGNLDAGYYYNTSLAFDLTGICPLGKDKAELRLDYVYNDGDEANNATRDYEHLFSVNYAGKTDKFGFIWDLIYAKGLEDVSDAYGAVLMPTYDITDKLKLVLRYQYAKSDEEDGLRAQSRYERHIPNLTNGGRGDEYHAFYGGLNYYLCEDKFKIMAGAEYSTMDDSANNGGDFDGWTAFLGFRMYF